LSSRRKAVPAVAVVPDPLENSEAADVAPATGAAGENGEFDPACDAIALAFPGGADRAGAQVVDRTTGTDICIAGVPALSAAIGLPLGNVTIDARSGLLIYALASVGDQGLVVLTYPLPLVERLIGNDDRLPVHRAALVVRGQERVIADTLGDVPQMLRLESRAVIGQTGMQLVLGTSRSWFNGPELIGLLTPLGMWLLAALLSWLVIDRILLTPIQRLERSMARYRPGDTLESPRSILFAAQEVETLQDTIERLTRDVASDKTALAAGLDAQRQLTREVHHRVKNNLQIIASLISLHSRDAKGQDEIAAYRGIQRRVDALAVVHRHLHADTEEASGIALNTMLGELSVGLRHSLASEYGVVAVTIAVDPAQANQDVALPVAFFVTELVELACWCNAQAPIAIHMHRRPGDLATLSVQSSALSDCADTAGDRFASYERVLTGLSRQLRQPLHHDAMAGRYSIDIPVLAFTATTAPDLY
jgi:two-component system, sensor histidine kinase PdtaS